MKRYYSYIAAFAAVILALAGCKGKKEQEVIEPRWLASDRPEAYLYSIDDETNPDAVTVSVTDTLIRGAKLQAVPLRTAIRLHLKA